MSYFPKWEPRSAVPGPGEASGPGTVTAGSGGALVMVGGSTFRFVRAGHLFPAPVMQSVLHTIQASHGSVTALCCLIQRCHMRGDLPGASRSNIYDIRA